MGNVVGVVQLPGVPLAGFKPQTVSPNSDGVIAVTTTDEGKDEVGMMLIHKVQQNILYS